MRGCLKASPIVRDFLQIMSTTRVFPKPASWLQGMLVRAAVEIVPTEVRTCLGLTHHDGLRRSERQIVTWAGALADRVVLAESPAVQSCTRLGLPVHYLYA